MKNTYRWIRRTEFYQSARLVGVFMKRQTFMGFVIESDSFETETPIKYGLIKFYGGIFNQRHLAMHSHPNTINKRDSID